ncbi:MAG TPA: exonuclease SbcCD subunit D C-terminal domain-containing protein [Kofleriaceae bacterium]|nr:exonuclease SbcCD subunit D C-terminal domain-containing protein [Kofleriaceae bacterium]
MQILHTADWHLGHTLHGLSRHREHGAFLGWLERVIDAEAIDALIIAGDVFDAANPPASAQNLWFDFLARIGHRDRHLDVVVIAGNHDSAARLTAPEPLLDRLGVRVIGRVARHGDGRLDDERMIVPLSDATGEIGAWLCAVPFLRPADLPRAPQEVDPLIWGVGEVYREVIDLARGRQQPGQALVACGHLYMVGTAVSHLSERRILGGNQHALPIDLFPDDVAYVALGHLHKAQRVGGRDHVRYAGSPIPLSMGEAGYRHQVCVVTLEGEAFAGVKSVPVPRTIDVVRVPAHGALPLAEAMDRLTALEAGDLDDGAPYLEVSVALTRPEPGLRAAIVAALAGRRARLCKVSVSYTGTGASLADAEAARPLSDLGPDEVLRRRWQRDHQGEPPAAMVAAYHELIDSVMAEQAP